MRKLLVAILIIFTSCDRPTDPIDTCINNIFLETNASIEDVYHTELRSIGMQGMHGIRELSLGFSYKGTLSIDEARRIIIDCADKFIKNINSNTMLRPHLIEFPFPSSRIHLYIILVDGTFDPIRTPGILMSFALHKGIIQYHTITEKGPLQSIDQKLLMHSETFEEAKRILENE